MSNEKMPMQPIVKHEGDGHRTIRFKPNELVRYLLDNGGLDLNHLASVDFPNEDREQFVQLIGYSIMGYHELSYVSDESAAEASRQSEKRFGEDPGCRSAGCPIHGGG